MKAVLCPVCGGSGKYYEEGKFYEMRCHGCNSKGWVEVQGEINWKPKDIEPYEPRTFPYTDSGTSTYSLEGKDWTYTIM